MADQRFLIEYRIDIVDNRSNFTRFDFRILPIQLDRAGLQAA